MSAQRSQIEGMWKAFQERLRPAPAATAAKDEMTTDDIVGTLTDDDIEVMTLLTMMKTYTDDMTDPDVEEVMATSRRDTPEHKQKRRAVS